MYSATRFRYAPRGTEVLLTCELTSDLQYVTVEVSDSGPGVAESMLDDIFKPFTGRILAETATAEGPVGD
jgi:signal transduction histidine kinase